MSKDKVHLLSPLFLRYQADFEKNPKSRVFAPLAEMYRKIGMTDKAMEILAHGIKYHQNYLMGHLGLAFCYYDIKQYRLAYNTLSPLVSDNRDNIRLQKLFIDTCLALDLSKEALDTCKYLLFLNPKDKEVAEIVTRLESELERSYRHEHRPIFIPTEEFHSENDKEAQRLESFDFDDWQTVDLVKEEDLKTIEENKFDQWNVQKLDGPIKQVETKLETQPVIAVQQTVVVQKEERKETEQEIEEEISFSVNLTNENKHHPISVSMDDEAPVEDQRQKKMAQELPMITHTLVDLYCGQGHFEKAIEVLDKILELNPNEERTIKKKNEILALLNNSPAPVAKNPTKKVKEQTNIESEEDGRKSLMDIFDQSVSSINFDTLNLEQSDGSYDDEELDEMPIAHANEQSDLSKSLKENLLVLKEHSEIKPKTSKAIDNDLILMKRNQAIEERLNKFLSNIRKRALDYQGSF